MLSTNGRTRVKRQSGFTLVELLVALTVLMIGVAGILGMHLTSMRAAAYSRHATEAAVLGEDRMEELRTLPTAALTAGTDTVNPQGLADVDGYYTRAWSVTWGGGGTLATLTVTVSWLERGFEPHSVIMRTQRSL